MRALKLGPVVELSIGGQPLAPPTLKQALEHAPGSGLLKGPGIDSARLMVAIEGAGERISACSAV
jgi:hypothetical protein